MFACVIFNSLRSDGDRGTFGSARECSRCGLSVMGLLLCVLWGYSRMAIAQLYIQLAICLPLIKRRNFMYNAI